MILISPFVACPRGRFMRETDLVMELLETLRQRECNGHASVRLGTAIADPATFDDIFTRFSRGTYFEHVDLDIHPVDPAITCDCGYTGPVTSPDKISRCPRCGGTPDLSRGTEFEVVEPRPDDV
ncbi:MAG: hydrogenase maturation nickel metallochaperone HypA [Candidatus Nanohaloarchaea archaeon]